MKNKPLDFQEATAKHVLEAFKNHQKRVLVADEAGLGKTTVASEVVQRVKVELHKEVVEDDGLYCIIYVCCNLQIAAQNIDTLSDDSAKVDLSQSRLSMQHFVYFKKKAELQRNNQDTLVLSLTPTTSFQMTAATGSADERALIYACLSLFDDYADSDKLQQLSDIFVYGAPGVWGYLSQKYYREVRQPELEEYRKTIKESLLPYLERQYTEKQTLRQFILSLCDRTNNDRWESQCKDVITLLRKIFADISLEVMKPDLVIMDEFQKFSSLIVTDKEEETEENKIARKFFANKDTYILLLSATPYKPFTTLEELNENNNDEQYKDFNRLMDFLHENNTAVVDYKGIWKSYSAALNHLEDTEQEQILSKHNNAENMLYHVMGRTERINDGIIHYEPSDLTDYVNSGDILSYLQMQQLVDSCRNHGKNVESAQTDYVKSSAYQLSFMDNYKMKENIAEAWKLGAGKGLNTECLLLNQKNIEDYSLDSYQNARLNYVIDAILGRGRKSKNVEQLLWVPASHPYYKQTPNIFSENKDFSKYLIFSSWGMVPKMLACMLTYEAERRLYKRAFSKPTYTAESQTYLHDDKNSKSKVCLTKVSTFLADLYDPEEYYGKPLSFIKQEISKQVSKKIATFTGRTVNYVGTEDTYNLLKCLDDDSLNPRNISTKAVEVLTDIAIGSPAMCFYRIFHRLNDEQAKEHAEDVADAFVAIFNNRYGVGAVRCNTSRDKNYFQRVIDYCIIGNLQSVLDEYVHMIGESKSPEAIATKIKESFASVYRQPVNSIQTFGTDAKYSMHKHFAVDFGSGKQAEKDVKHATNVRDAFNSPFRPFVLASTSVGQEGLDFHWYCRKMIHWNLPSNPQNLEQREGRINRYKCLSVRRNIAKLYEKDDIFSWKEMFDRAKSDLKKENSEMVPFWYLPLNDDKFNGIDKEYLERIVPIYPLSEEEEKYDRLIKVLSLYRLTMGQPRQEELLQLLEGKVTKEQMKQLLFDLSPFSRNRKHENISI